ALGIENDSCEALARTHAALGDSTKRLPGPRKSAAEREFLERMTCTSAGMYKAFLTRLAYFCGRFQHGGPTTIPLHDRRRSAPCSRHARDMDGTSGTRSPC